MFKDHERASLEENTVVVSSFLQSNSQNLLISASEVKNK